MEIARINISDFLANQLINYYFDIPKINQERHMKKFVYDEDIKDLEMKTNSILDVDKSIFEKLYNTIFVSDIPAIRKSDCPYVAITSSIFENEFRFTVRSDQYPIRLDDIMPLSIGYFIDGHEKIVWKN
jgi:hypothetical protein